MVLTDGHWPARAGKACAGTGRERSCTLVTRARRLRRGTWERVEEGVGWLSQAPLSHAWDGKANAMDGRGLRGRCPALGLHARLAARPAVPRLPFRKRKLKRLRVACQAYPQPRDSAARCLLGGDGIGVGSSPKAARLWDVACDLPRFAGPAIEGRLRIISGLCARPLYNVTNHTRNNCEQRPCKR